MSVTYLKNTVQRPLTDYLGEYVSVLAYGAVGDGTSDDSAAINLAITSLIGIGGKDLYFPGGKTYKVNSPIVVPKGTANIRMVGDGVSSVIKRGAAMTEGKGVIDIQEATGVVLKSLKIDGNVTTPTGYTYGNPGDFNNDPMHKNLTTNTSVWVHSGSKQITFKDVTIIHTGGYAVLIDATTADIVDVFVIDSLVENCRPHLFGSVATDQNYGSWTGGIHFQSDGSTYSVSNATVRGCTFRRITGNAVWSHMYALTKLHTNIRITDNHFEDIGRDGIMVGGVIGGVVANNTFRRIGYVALADTGIGTPKWLANNYAVGLDTAGLVRNVNYTGNSFVSVNGGCMDLDGYADGAVYGNVCTMPVATDPEYTEDNIIKTGPSNDGANWTYGAQVSNTNDDVRAATDVIIQNNTFNNMGGGAVRLYASRNCTVCSNIIRHPDAPNFVPIAVGNIGLGDLASRTYNRSFGDVVADNVVYYSPGAAAPVVYEDDQYCAFDPTDKNWIAGNHVLGNGNAYEYSKSETVVNATVTASMHTSVARSTAKNATLVQREGLGNAAYTRWYSSTDSGDVVIMTLLDSGLLNVSRDGAVKTGAITTGGRTTLAFMDCVASGKGYFDGFLVIGSATWDDNDANLLDESVGLIRYNSTDKKLEKSISVLNGARVWTDLGFVVEPVFTVPKSDTTDLGGQIVLEGGNKFGGGTWQNMVLDNTQGCFRVWGSGGNNYGNMLIYGTPDQASLTLAYGYVSSPQGFYSVSAQYNALQLISGGASVKGIRISDVSGSGGYLAFNRFNAVAPTALSGDSLTDVFTLHYRYSTTVGDTDDSLNFRHSGALRMRLTAAGNLILPGANSAQVILVQDGYIDSAEGIKSVAGVADALYLRVTDGTVEKAGFRYYNSKLQFSHDLTTWENIGAALPAGVLGQTMRFDATLGWTGSSLIYNNGTYIGVGTISPSYLLDLRYTSDVSLLHFASSDVDSGGYLRSSGSASISLSSGAAWNGSGWLAKATSAAILHHDTGRCDFYADTGLTAGASFTPTRRLVLYPSGGLVLGSAIVGTDPGGAKLYVEGVNDTAGINLSYGYVQAGGGFYTTAATSNAIQAPSGGVYGQWLIAAQAVYFATIGTSTNPTGSSASYGGIGHRSGSTFWYWTGSSWSYVDFALTLPAGTTNYTLRYNGSSWVSSSALTNDGTNIQTSGTLRVGSHFYMPNNCGIHFRLYGTTTDKQVLVRGTDNHIYLENWDVTNGDIYIRPATGRYVLVGTTYGDVCLAPNSTYGTKTLGNSTYYWDSINCAEYKYGGTTLIDSNGRFVGLGVAVASYGVGAAGFNWWNGSSYISGWTGTYRDLDGYTITVKGGIIISRT